MPMKNLLNASLAYMAVGVGSGLFYREFTKLNDFPPGQFTQLGLAHTHLLTLGFLVLLAVEQFGARAQSLHRLGGAAIEQQAPGRELPQPGCAILVAKALQQVVEQRQAVRLFGHARAQFEVGSRCLAAAHRRIRPRGGLESSGAAANAHPRIAHPELPTEVGACALPAIS